MSTEDVALSWVQRPLIRPDHLRILAAIFCLSQNILKSYRRVKGCSIHTYRCRVQGLPPKAGQKDDVTQTYTTQ